VESLIGLLKWIIGIVLVVAVLGGSAAVFLWPRVDAYWKAQALANMPASVDVETVSRGELVRTIAAPGTVKPRTEVQIASRVSATIVSIPLREGDEVRPGDILAQLDRKELEARLSASRARLLSDEASLKASEARLAADRANLVGIKSSLDKAIADFERNEELFSSGDISRADLDASRNELENRRASHESALASLEGSIANVEASRANVLVGEADVEQAVENLDYTTIRAPMAGVITMVNSREGEVALGTIQNAGTVIMTIADLSEMLVEAQLTEVDAPRVQEGQRVSVYLNPYPGRVFSGRLRRIGLQSRSSNDGANVFDAEVVLDPTDDRLFSGLTANVDIEVDRIENVIVVPSQAVLDKRFDELPLEVRSSPLIDTTRPRVQVVFVLEDGLAKMRPVRTIASSITRTAIAEGLEVGEQVISGPFASLRTMNHDDRVEGRVRGGGNSEGRPDRVATQPRGRQG
jgi:HlyD family secretion protein